MMFSFFGRKVKPRGLTWVPTTYDPEKELSRPERMRLDTHLNYKRKKRLRQSNPALLSLLAVLIAAAMWYLDRQQDVATEVEPITLSVSDAVSDDHSTTSGETVQESTTDDTTASEDPDHH